MPRTKRDSKRKTPRRNRVPGDSPDNLRGEGDSGLIPKLTIFYEELHPVQKLCLAVLQDAIFCLKPSKAKHPRLRKEAEILRKEALYWVDYSNPSYIFSFHSVCCILDLDPDVVRHELVREGLVPPMVKRRKSARKFVKSKHPRSVLD